MQRLKLMVDKLTLQLARHARSQYGASSERFADGQTSLIEPAVLDELPRAKTAVAAAANSTGADRSLPEHLPREQHDIRPEASAAHHDALGQPCGCTTCGGPAARTGCGLEHPVVGEGAVSELPDREVGSRAAREVHAVEVRLPERRVSHPDEAPDGLRMCQHVPDHVHRGQVDCRRHGLVALGVHPVPQEHHLLPRGQWPLAGGEGAGSRHSRVGAVRGRDLGAQAQQQQEAVEAGAGAGPEDAKAGALAVPPMAQPGQRRRPFVATNQRLERRELVVARRLDGMPTQRLPVEEVALVRQVPRGVCRRHLSPAASKRSSRLMSVSLSSRDEEALDTAAARSHRVSVMSAPASGNPK